MKLASLSVLTVLLASATNMAVAEDSGNVNIWNWSYNIGENTVADFEKDTGLKTNYVEFDSNELQEARLLGALRFPVTKSTLSMSGLTHFQTILLLSVMTLTVVVKNTTNTGLLMFILSVRIF